MLSKFDISFEVKEQKIEFAIVTNLPKKALDVMEDAITNWAVRTKDHTDQSLCNYLLEKHPEAIILPYDTYKFIESEVTNGK